MAKTPAQIRNDYEFQNPGETLQDIINFLETIDSPTPLGTRWTAVGDSQTYANNRLTSYTHWFNLAMNGRLLFPQTINMATNNVYGGQCGVTGQTSTQIAARAGTFNTHNGIYILLMGENDTAAVSEATQKANFETIFQELSAAKYIFVVPFTPSKQVFASSTIQARNANILSWLRGTAKTTYRNVVTLPDAVWHDIYMHDGAGGAGPDSTDGIHPNNIGAYKLGNNIAAVVNAYVEAGDANDWTADFTELYGVDFSGTGGTAGAGSTGDVADGLTLTASNTTGLTVTASKGTLNGNDSQIVTITGTSSSSTSIYVYLGKTIIENISAGTGILSTGDIKVTGSNGGALPQGLQGVAFDATYNIHTWGAVLNAVSEGELPFNFSGKYINTPVAEVSAAGAIGTRLVLRISPSSTVDIRMEVADVKVFDMLDEGIL